jgi:hypothetical protein
VGSRPLSYLIRSVVSPRNHRSGQLLDYGSIGNPCYVVPVRHSHFLIITSLHHRRCAASTGPDSSSSSTSWMRYHAPSSSYLFIAHRKPTSYLWTVPEDDRDLLDGVGANGNEFKKADERFEVMLLMDMLNSDDGQ